MAKIGSNTVPSWLKEPLATGIMLLTQPAQVCGARVSLKSFLRQNWSNRELLILNTTSVPVRKWWMRNVREIVIRCSNAHMLLPLAFDNSFGEWCVEWRTDCYYEPDYLGEHLKHADKRRLALFRNFQVYALSSGKTYHAFSGDLMFWSAYRYYSADFSQPLDQLFPDVRRVDNAPSLLTRYVKDVVQA